MAYIPYHFTTQEICNEVMRNSPWALRFIPYHLKIQEMCSEAVEACPWTLEHVPNNLKIQKMCNEAVRRGLWNLRHVSDSFVTQQQIKIWHGDTYYCNDDRLIRCCHDYQKRKAQKASIKKEILPIACHPSRYWDQKMKKGTQKHCGHKDGFFVSDDRIQKNFLTREK